MNTQHPLFKSVCMFLAVGVLGVSTTLGGNLKSTDTKSEVKSSRSLTKKAHRLMEQEQEIAVAGELLNESIKIMASVENLELKGDQYVMMEMENNALYFYQKALEVGIESESKFDVRDIQEKILKLQPSSAYLLALADNYIAAGETDHALETYVQILKQAQSKDYF